MAQGLANRAFPPAATDMAQEGTSPHGVTYTSVDGSTGALGRIVTTWWVEPARSSTATCAAERCGGPYGAPV